MRGSIRSYCDPFERIIPPSHFRGPTLNTIDLSQTCQHLRYLSITNIYSRLSIFNPKNLPGLRTLLVSYPHIAACVRHLCIMPGHISMYPGLKHEPLMVSQEEFTLLVRGILQSCKNLRSLKLADSIHRPRILDFDSTTLEHLAIESRQSLELIALTGMGLLALLEHLKKVSDFKCSPLKQMDFLGSTCGPEEMTVEPLAFGPTALRFESVQSFSFSFSFSDEVSVIHQRQVGEFFAKATPCVTVLNMASSPECINGAMSAYANLGSRFTKLTLSTWRASSITSDPLRNHTCLIVSKLAPSLTDLSLTGVLCHELFTTSEWPHIATINLHCLYGCQGHKPTILRKKMKHLTVARPRTLINIRLRSRTLVDISSYRDKWDMLEGSLGFPFYSEHDWWGARNEI